MTKKEFMACIERDVEVIAREKDVAKDEARKMLYDAIADAFKMGELI